MLISSELRIYPQQEKFREQCFEIGNDPVTFCKERVCTEYMYVFKDLEYAVGIFKVLLTQVQCHYTDQTLRLAYYGGTNADRVSTETFFGKPVIEVRGTRVRDIHNYLLDNGFLKPQVLGFIQVNI